MNDSLAYNPALCLLDSDRHDKGPAISRKIDIPATMALMVTMMCWGVAPAMLRFFAIKDIIPDGFSSNLVRYPVGALLYLPLLIRFATRRQVGRLWLLALVPAVANTIAQTLWATAPYYLEVPLIAFLIRISVIFSILGAFCVFSDERRLLRSVTFWTGAMLSVVGFVVMAVAGGAAAGEVSVSGVLIVLCCAVFHAAYGISVRYVMGGENPLLTFALVGLYTAVGLATLGPLGEPGQMRDCTAAQWGLIVISAIIGVSAGHGFYYYAVQRIGVAISTLTLTATPFVTAITAWIWFGEGMTTLQLGGGVLLAFGSVVAIRSQQHLVPSATDQRAEEQAAQP